MNLFRLLLFTVVLFSTTVNAQLQSFNLQVDKTDETCLGNGSITINVTNVTQQATMLYKVYHLPDVTNPIAILTTDNTVNSLTSGAYRVVAIQALGSQSNSQQQDVTINNAITNYTFSVAAANQSCADGGNIVVNTITGYPAAYEIMSGPVTRPLQESNVFTNLPSGTYNIRVFDICGMGKVKTFTLSVVNSVLTISQPSLTNTEACDEVTVSNTISSSGGAISYPLTVRHTLNPMNMSGESLVINQVLTTGSQESVTVSAVVPRYMTDSYTYELSVTDNCNVVYEKTDNLVDPSINLSLSTGNAPCSQKFLIVSPSMHKAPYTINFVSAPADFTASDFNPEAGGQLTSQNVQFGDAEHPVPFGTYVVEITDACGRTALQSIDVEFIVPTPSARGTNNGCFSEFGRIRVSVPDTKIISATLLAAPAAYTATNTLPKNITASITNGTIALNNMPLGVYTIEFTDECGNTYQKDVEVPPFVEKPFNIAALPDCEAGLGTIRLRSGNGNLTSAIIIAAPVAYSVSHTLPYNVTSILNGGDLYMNNLPQGTYTIRAVDQCGITHDMSVNVEGHIPATADSIAFTPNCGGFSAKVTDSSNGREGASYWLQMFNPATNAWVNPGNGAAYTEGADPVNSGIKLTNNVVRNNINYSGKFRIVKRFEAFNQGSATNSICVSVLGEFIYTDGLTISNAYSLACIGEPNTVYIEALGYPTAYRIIKKNGANFVLQNGTNNIFRNLEPADYVFQVEDACGNIITKPVSVQMLPSITEASQPTDMVACTEEGPAGGNQVFRLADQNASVLGSLPAAMYTITYHLTQADADNGVNPLPEYYTNVINNQTIYARLIHNEIPLCHGTTSFKLHLGQYPTPVITTTGKICDGNSIALTANAGYSSYLWSNGATTRTIYVTEPGLYTVIVQKAYGDQYCEAFAEAEVKASATPRIVKVESTDWSENDNTITVYAEGASEYEYSLDGIHWQESNHFTGLEPGLYNVFVKDGLGCGFAQKEVVLLYYPKFFTPNGDGYNEKWQIKYSILEPRMKIQVFDRYGKLITGFNGLSDGWDGTLNGQKLPSTDYWFVVTREDGREYRGHFAMMR